MRKKKTDKKKLVKDVARVIKKTSDHEKKKSDEKKKLKQSRPKGMMARRAGMFTFWILFSFMFIVTMANVFGGGDVTYDEALNRERNKLLDGEGVEFARSFVHDYFNWDIGKHGENDLRMRVSPYLTENLNELAGIQYDDKWMSQVDKRNIELKDVQEIDKNKARFVFKVKLTMKSPTTEKDTVFDEEELSFEEVVQAKNKVYVKDGFKVKDMVKYISVPVYYDEETDTFAVFDLPSFTYVDEKGTKEPFTTRISELQVISDAYIENNINSFLTTFFASYSKDSKDKLSYILEDERHVNGLQGTMEFSKINESKIYEIDENHNRFLVDVTVEMVEPTTKYKFDNKYLVVIKRKDQRYVVESLNDEKYVYELVEKYLEQFEKEDDELGELTDLSEFQEHDNNANDYKYEGEDVEDDLEGMDDFEEDDFELEMDEDTE